MTMTSGARPVRAARGTELSCLGWQQEAALRMAAEKVHFEGLPARICWLGYGERNRAGARFNELVASGIGRSIHAGQVCVADGTELAAQKLERVLTNDPGMGVIRHVDAGYERAAGVAADRGVRVPMLEQP